MFQFDWPWVFAALPLPVAVYFFSPRANREEMALKVPFFQQIDSLYQQSKNRALQSQLLNIILLALIWLLLVAAAARPQWMGEAVTLPSSGRDLLLAVDISGSMKTADMVVQNQQIPRVLVVKYVVSDFIKRRESDRIGLILFGTQAYLQAPLTFDKPSVEQLLQEAQLGFAGEKTAIGDAVGLAIKRLRDRPDSQRVLILLTDGANTAGEVSPRQAADLAKQAGIKIYTIGMGANEMTVNRGFFNNFGRTINPSADLDEETLQYMADTTGGRFFRATNPEQLQEIYALLDQLEPIEQEGEVMRPVSSLFFWPLAAALLLSMSLPLPGLISSFAVKP
ncbi:MAG: VWA domain-containing protein [Cellvibrionaceae bacterium]|nr:VWA domain-containing protein [Cellvibrionaceae bacterium]